MSVTLLNGPSHTPVRWVPGLVDSGNLLGTIRSLDGIYGSINLNCTLIANKTVNNEGLHCAWGLVSRSGWSLIDDTSGPYLDPDEWPSDTPSSDVYDWYFFGHGHEYRKALADYSKVGLPIPMMPKYMLGIAWTRWYSFTGAELLGIIDDYDSRQLPLDTVIIDMDWHKTFPAGQDKLANDYWTGYSFDPELFPYPSAQLEQLRDRGVHIAVNLHDAMGVQHWEDRYVQMAQAHGVDPDSNNPVPFNVTDRFYMDSLEAIVMQPVYDAGVDFAWIDWQQGGSLGVYRPGVNPTFMLNYYRHTQQVRQQLNQRGLILARWGGMGNHRYQAGFSGDVQHSWPSLAFQPYFSTTATNIGYGYWVI